MRYLISRWASRLYAFSVYPIGTWLPSHASGDTTGAPSVPPPRSSRTRDSSPQTSCSHDRYAPNCLTTVWTLLANRFNGRTAQPLERTTAPGCDEPTSRCQTSPSIWTLGGDKPVIPRVTFIRWALAFPLTTIGSLSPAFASARVVTLAVRPASAFARLHTISDRVKPTFERLRYSLGGDRPSQTAHLTLSSYRITVTS